MYNLEVRLGTLLCAMLQPLRSRPANFESAVATHFSLKRWEVAAQAVQWCEEAVLFAFFAVEVQRNPLARANAEGKRLCKEFLASGTCQKGVACMYSHVRADSQVDYRKYAPLLAITYGVFGEWLAALCAAYIYAALVSRNTHTHKTHPPLCLQKTLA